jgi:hypothetical protein
MKGKTPPLDVGSLVHQLGDAAPGPAAVASARELVRSWFQWKAPGTSAAAKRTLLHVAAHYGSPGALRTLLDLGADPNAAGEDGATPMHCACHARGDGLAEVLEVLLSRGADRELRDSLGRRPIDLLLAQVGLRRGQRASWQGAVVPRWPGLFFGVSRRAAALTPRRAAPPQADALG